MKAYTKCAKCGHQSVTDGSSFSSKPCPVCGGTAVNIEIGSGQPPEWFVLDKFLYVPEFTWFSILAAAVAGIAAYMGNWNAMWWTLGGIPLDMAACAFNQYLKWKNHD